MMLVITTPQRAKLRPLFFNSLDTLRWRSLTPDGWPYGQAETGRPGRLAC